MPKPENAGNQGKGRDKSANPAVHSVENQQERRLSVTSNNAAFEAWFYGLRERKFIEVWDVVGVDMPPIEHLCDLERRALRHPMLLDAERRGLLQRHVVTLREPPVYWTHAIEAETSE